MLKKCSTCKNPKPISCFHKNSYGKFGVHNKCKSCRKDYYTSSRGRAVSLKASKKFLSTERGREMVRRSVRKIAATPKGKAQKRKSGARWRHKYPEKKKAHAAVEYALLKGALTKGPCYICKSIYRIEGHHYLGYSKEHRLHVQWLCKKHHIEADSKMGRLANV